jgi:molecular chaperone DnaJ
MTSHYETLGVSKDASQDDIKKAFRKLAKACHPDIAGDDPAAELRFKAVNSANEVLSDPEKRSDYDRSQHATHFNFDPFEQVRNMAQRGANVGVRTIIEFVDAIQGVEIEIEAPKWLVCEDCAGAGHIDSGETCDYCDGSGKTTHIVGKYMLSQTCPKCSGHGRILNRCLTCHGSGFTTIPRQIKVTVPPGVDQGSVLRIHEQGRPGINGGPAGDLLVQINVNPHEYFTRKGGDIHVNVPISYKTACLGGEEIVQTLEGDVRVTIPVGTAHGSTLSLSGRGMSIAGHRPGHQYCHVEIEVLGSVSGEVEEKLDQLEEAIAKTMTPLSDEE